MYLKFSPSKSRGYINKMIIALIAFIGFFSTVIGLIQFFNVEPLPVIEGEFCLNDNSISNRRNLILLINKIATNSGNMVYFKDATFV